MCDYDNMFPDGWLDERPSLSDVLSTANGSNSTVGNVSDYYSLQDLFNSYEEFGIEDSFFTYQEATTIVLICLYVPVFIIALFTNVIVILVVYRNSHVRR